MKKLFYLGAIILASVTLFAQGVGINPSGNAPAGSAGLDIDFPDKGVLIPRLTAAQRDAISAPAEGLQIYNTDSKCINLFVSPGWVEMCGNCIPQPTAANAGPDQPAVASPATLAANTPSEGTGAWTIVSSDGNGVIADTTDPASAFSGTINETYVLRWTVSNSCGSSQDEVSISVINPFTCGDTFEDTRDNQMYTTVQIGSQCWMAKNLNIGTMINGSGDQTNNAVLEKYCYNDNTNDCDSYGGLYQFEEMMQYVTTESTQGICPAGWHLPSDQEVKDLEIALGMSPTDANNTGWRGSEGNTMRGGSFALLSGGWRTEAAAFFDQGNSTVLRTSSLDDPTHAWTRYFHITQAGIVRGADVHGRGGSVRCVQD